MTPVPSRRRATLKALAWFLAAVAIGYAVTGFVTTHFAIHDGVIYRIQRVNE
jgi:hypothetical protein